MEAVTINYPFEHESSPDAEPPSEMLEVPILGHYLQHPEDWVRIHIVVIGVRPKGTEVDGIIFNSTSATRGIQGLNMFGTTHFAGKPSPYIAIETVGDDTGHDDKYFHVGKFKSAVERGALLPSWDETALLLCKKGKECTSGLKLTMINNKNKHEIMSYMIDESELPPPGADFKEMFLSAGTPAEDVTFGGMELKIQIKVSSCTDKIIKKEELAAMFKDTDTVSYTEEVIEGDPDHPEDNALLQCWRHKTTAKRAVLWVLGRNDCFMHPHVAKEMFLSHGYDIYVLNWSCNGMCRLRGWFKDSYFNSHNRLGDASLYEHQIEGALRKIKSYANYDTLLGYAHSTGGVVLINYLIDKGDGPFSGFIFNSPLLDWSQSRSEGATILEILSAVGQFCGVKDKNFILTVSLASWKLTDLTEDKKPITYLGREVDMNSWSLTLFSKYFYDFRVRPFYSVPMTTGFVDFVKKVDKKLIDLYRENRHVTLKPLICFASKMDKTLTDNELTLERIDALGPSRCEVQLRHNTHDIFLSHEMKDNDMAMDMAKAWMRTRGFL